MSQQDRIASTFSRRVGMFALGAALLTLLGVQSGCNQGGGGPVTVPMEFRPEHSEPISAPLNPGDVKVYLAPATDKRPEKDTIGKNIESSTPVPIYSSGKTPPEFFHDVLDDELKSLGVQMADAPETADRTINIELTRFFVEEKSNYHAEVKALVEVKDKGGRSLYRGQVAGDGQTFGRSLNPENYQQTLSDATRRAIGNLVNQPKFQEALQR
jgi:hypothetical protein